MMGEGTGLMHSSILEKIDGLFACNIGEYINLPQLVVVGNQSSGKSSVLAALTDLPFPRDSGLCTRFATQITFRRSTKAEISVSIIPSKHSGDEHQQKMKEFEKKLETWDSVAFGDLMQEVRRLFLSAQPYANKTRPQLSWELASRRNHLLPWRFPAMFW